MFSLFSLVERVDWVDTHQRTIIRIFFFDHLKFPKVEERDFERLQLPHPRLPNQLMEAVFFLLWTSENNIKKFFACNKFQKILYDLIMYKFAYFKTSYSLITSTRSWITIIVINWVIMRTVTRSARPSTTISSTTVMVANVLVIVRRSSI